MEIVWHTGIVVVVVVVATVGAVGGSNWYVTLKLPELVVALNAESTACLAALFDTCEALGERVEEGPGPEVAKSPTGTATSAAHAATPATNPMRWRFARLRDGPLPSSIQRPPSSEGCSIPPAGVLLSIGAPPWPARRRLGR
jgi:hypothetical protein